jgi:hypothetical protein
MSAVDVSPWQLYQQRADELRRAIVWLGTIAGELEAMAKCPSCAGTGRWVKQDCLRCLGKGFQDENDVIKNKARDLHQMNKISEGFMACWSCETTGAQCVEGCQCLKCVAPEIYDRWRRENPTQYAAWLVRQGGAA